MMHKCVSENFREVFEVINDGASAYKGIIPQDRWHEPYMTEEELLAQVNQGVEFWVYTDNNRITGVMGIQGKEDVTLIRHAYVRTAERNKGIGSRLLKHLLAIGDEVFTVNDGSLDIVFTDQVQQRLLALDLWELAEISITPEKIEGVVDQSILSTGGKFGLQY